MPKTIILPVDDSNDSERVFIFCLDNIFHSGDEIHLVHIIPRHSFAAGVALPAVDVTPSIDRDKYEAALRKAEAFLVKRFLSRFPPESETTPIVHIVKSETDSESVGHVICQKAEDLKANAVVMGCHQKGLMHDLFMGSISQYVLHHCKRPVMVIKNV